MLSRYRTNIKNIGKPTPDRELMVVASFSLPSHAKDEFTATITNIIKKPDVIDAITQSQSGLYLREEEDNKFFSTISWQLCVYVNKQLATFWRIKYSEFMATLN